MNSADFISLKIGDRVKTNLSGEATVIRTAPKKELPVILKCDVKKWSCPYFYRSEIEKKISKDE